jgi:glycosyltransferase involved in cell wall biosynthesis
MFKINVIYHHFPHYRRPVMRELVKSGRHEYRFFASTADLAGIKTFKGDDLVSIVPLRFRYFGPIWILKGYWPAVLDPAADVLIVHGPPNMPASWLIGLAGRLTGKKVVYWAHGWLKREPPLKALIRRLHYRLGHRVMTYAERARNLATDGGFPAERVVPIYNSLDWLTARQVLQRLQVEGTLGVRRKNGMPPEAFIINCVARLTRLCRFDILLDAMSILQQKGVVTRLFLIGDGPERQALERRACGLSLDVSFLGELYDEETVGSYVFASDVTVSPGKVGLSAVHSMMYGTPVISHDDLDGQMPEVEAILEGRTGSLFEKDNPAALADAILFWRNRSDRRCETRSACLDVIEGRYNPVTQAELINATVDAVMRKSR